MSAISQCDACGCVFVSVKAFDAHRTGPYTRGSRRCLTAPELQAKGMVQDEKGRWRLPEAQASESGALPA